MELIREEAAVTFSLDTALNWYFVSLIDHVQEASYGQVSLGSAFGRMVNWALCLFNTIVLPSFQPFGSIVFLHLFSQR